MFRILKVCYIFAVVYTIFKKSRTPVKGKDCAAL